jgi:hypothetical protein
MIDYDWFATAIEDSIKTKIGLENCVSDIAGSICHGIRQGIITNIDAREYFRILLDTDIGNIPADHQWHRLVDQLPQAMQNNRTTLYLERRLSSYNGGLKAQIGPGEFIMSWYSQDSVFQTDNQKDGDIIIKELVLEKKKANGNNDASAEMFDNYIGKVDRLVGVHTVSNAPKPNKRTQFISCEPVDWRKVFKFKLNKGCEPGDKRAWGLSTILPAVGNYNGK